MSAGSGSKWEAAAPACIRIHTINDHHAHVARPTRSGERRDCNEREQARAKHRIDEKQRTRRSQQGRDPDP